MRPDREPFKPDREAIALYDEYTHGTMPRREFLARLARIAGGTAAATLVLPVLENHYAAAATVPADDPALVIGRERIDAPGGAVEAYVACPKAVPAKRPAVVVIHENRGLNAHIEDVARRFARAGFLAIAPDALTGKGGSPANEDEARRLIGELDREQALAMYVAAVKFADAHPHSTGKVGCVGFCWGGGMAGRLAANCEELDAAVVFYGMPPAAEETASVRVPLLLHYAGLDSRINAAVPAFEKELKAAGAKYQLYMYDGVEHAFHNDTNAARYDAEAAALAWKRTVDFLNAGLA